MIGNDSQHNDQRDELNELHYCIHSDEITLLIMKLLKIQNENKQDETIEKENDKSNLSKLEMLVSIVIYIV